MTSVHERNFVRLRGALTCLAERGVPTPKDEVVAYVEKHWPPSGDDLDTISNGSPRWLPDFLWNTTNMVRAGWMTKDGRGNWSITADGRAALAKYPDPTVLYNQGNAHYQTWLHSRRTEQRRAWLVRGSSVRGANIVGAWLAEGFVSLAASQLRQIAPGVTAEELAAVAREDYDHLTHQDLIAKVDEIVAFVTRVSKGDVVITTDDQKVWLGDVTGEWEWHSSEERRSNLRRAVEWRNIDAPVEFADLPAPLPARLTTGATLADLTAQLDVIDGLTAPEPVVQRHEHLRPVSAGLAEELFVDHAWLEEVRELLDERRQVVFYGPPGTGKTYIARKLAAELAGPEQVKLVQFHPAYTYEDFFEGFRPRPGAADGTIAFELRPGPLRQLVGRASEHPEQAFVLVIDEINRANLAKVFGELYFLLEYRDQAIDLLYSSESEAGFTLPPNLYIIGTMNTADRSIALVDAAMRRRFAFVALDPATEPTKSLLARWSAAHGLTSRAADLLVELNRRLADKDFSIGPSYFMTSTAPDAFSEARLQRVWRTSVTPLLEEHFYGRWENREAQFALSALLRAVEGGGATSLEAAQDEGAGTTPEAS